MKILSVRIESFGKLGKTEIAFHDGLNVIRQVNGFGKTTLANFIRAMLYGFTYSRTGGVTDAARFQPWGSDGRFGGSMTVEHEGEIYRIERFFGATAKVEQKRYTNERTGREVFWDKQPGEILLGLTADSYDRSAYFPQEAVALRPNDNLDARLANLVQNSADDYDKIQQKLRDYKKNLQYERGSGGKIFLLQQQIDQLTGQLEQAGNALRRQKEIDSRMQQIASERQAINNAQIDCNGKLAQLNRKLAQSQPSEEEMRARARYEEINQRLKQVPSEFDADFSRAEDLARQIASIPTVSPVEKKPKSGYGRIILYSTATVLVLLGVMFLVLGIANVMNMITGVVLGCVILVIAIAAVFLFQPRKKKRVKSDPDPSEERPDLPPVTREQLESEFFFLAHKYVFAEVNDVESVRRALWKAHSDYQSDQRTLETLLPIVNRPQTDVSGLEQQLEEINGIKSQLDNRANALLREETGLAEERKRLVVNGVAVQDKLMECQAELEQAKRQYALAEKVSVMLEQAKDNLSSSYLPRLCKRTTELLQYVTQSNLEATVDRTFAVSLRERGQTKSMSEFSRGIREITLLCFRLALSELLYNGNIPFIIVDDAFVNFDEDNFVRATELLRQLSAHGQAVYLSCHSRSGKLL